MGIAVKVSRSWMLLNGFDLKLTEILTVLGRQNCLGFHDDGVKGQGHTVMEIL